MAFKQLQSGNYYIYIHKLIVNSDILLTLNKNSFILHNSIIIH